MCREAIQFWSNFMHDNSIDDFIYTDQSKLSIDLVFVPENSWAEQYLEQLKSSASRKLFCTHLCLAPHRAQLVFNSSLFFLVFVPCGRVFSFTRWYLPRAKLQNCIRKCSPTLSFPFPYATFWFSHCKKTGFKSFASYKKCIDSLPTVFFAENAQNLYPPYLGICAAGEIFFPKTTKTLKI